MDFPGRGFTVCSRPTSEQRRIRCTWDREIERWTRGSREGPQARHRRVAGQGARRSPATSAGDFDVEASVGHIRDLPEPVGAARRHEEGPVRQVRRRRATTASSPTTSSTPTRRRRSRELKRLLKDADELYLATDEDREGEAIAWHLLETLQPHGAGQADGVPRDHPRGDPARRHRHPRPRHPRWSTPRRPAASSTASTATRCSPVLWRKVRQGLSAGRVQSVATRLVVERERERMAFRRRVLLGRRGRLHARTAAAAATPSPRGSPRSTARRVATGRDFADDGDADQRQGGRPPRRGAGDRHRRRAVRAADVTVTDVSRRSPTRAARPRRSRRRPSSRRRRASCGCRRKNAMRVAQRLYENGYITYMRTDSTTLSEAAMTAARSQARDMYGADYVPDEPRRYEKKVKNAQEAHEAIRPAGDRFRTPGAGGRRAARRGVRALRADLEAHRRLADGRRPRLDRHRQARRATLRRRRRSRGPSSSRASGTVITFRGFLAAYEEGRDETPVARAQGRGRGGAPPAASSATGTAARGIVRAEADGHETQPPPRYTEATLVKAMEERGIGRPSTYAVDDRHDPGPRLRRHPRVGARSRPGSRSP